jgi:CRP-like cAMP-binding protein
MNGRQSDDGNDRPGQGPSVTARALWESSAGKRTQLLSDAERARLAVIASVVRFKAGTKIFGAGERADAVYNIISGTVKTYRTLPDGAERIAAFLFADDLLGLVEEGKYMNSARAVNSVTAYRIPVPALEARLKNDPSLEFHVICKLCHELREAQRHAFLLGRRGALGRITMFLQMLEQYQSARGDSVAELYMPMNRSDIGAYVGISPEAVSRSFRILADRGLVAFRDRRHVKIVDHAGFDKLASDNNGA